MSDTSLVFNILVRDRASAALNKIKGAAQDVANSVQRSLSRRTDTTRLHGEIEATKAKLRSLAQEYDRTGNRSLFKDMSRERGELRRLQSALGDMGSGGADSARQSLGNLSSMATNVTSNLWNLLPVLGGLAAGATVAVPAITLLGGALGSLPALAVGGGAILGVLGLGTMGLADAFKKGGSSAGAMADKLHQVQLAERGVRDAQYQAQQAQVAVNKARADARKGIDDLARALRGARLDEEAATLAVEDARKALQDAKATGNLDDIKHADLAYRQSLNTLDEVKIKLAETEVEHARAAQAGVDGSEQVQQALHQQQQATEAVTEAQYSLQKAHTDSAAASAASAADTIVLAASAQQFVDVVKSLKPAFDGLRLDVQERLFAGIGDKVKQLATAWMPTLHDKLGAVADTLNGLFRNFASHASTPEFISNIGIGADAANHALGRIGTAVSGPLVDAFGQLSRAASPFIDALGGEVAKLVEDFAKWIDKADKSHQLKEFFDKASSFLHDVFDMGRDVGAIIGDIVSAIFDTPSGGTDAWDSLKSSLHDVREWFDNPDNKQKVTDWASALGDMAKVFGYVIYWIAEYLLWMDAVEYALENVGYAIYDWATITVPKAFDKFMDWVKALPGRVGNAVSGLWDGMLLGFKGIINNIIWMWNKLHFTLPAIDWGPVHIGGTDIGVPHIPYLASGGTATSDGLAVVGERGPELLSLTRGATVTPLTGSRGGSGSGEVRLVLDLRGADGELKRLIRKWIRTDNLLQGG